MVSEHAQEQGWSFVGPVSVRIEELEDLATGVFRVRSSVVAGATGTHREPPAVPAQGAPSGSPRLEMGGRPIPVGTPVFVLGRGAEADLRLPDTGVSRRHAELHLQDGTVTLVDLSSTNGTTVNGRRVDRARLTDGDRIGVGATVLVYRQDG
jgi:pSer/pThr/pTyr-binding forkhead associated (FHA) protein